MGTLRNRPRRRGRRCLALGGPWQLASPLLCRRPAGHHPPAARPLLAIFRRQGKKGHRSRRDRPAERDRPAARLSRMPGSAPTPTATSRRSAMTTRAASNIAITPISASGRRRRNTTAAPSFGKALPKLRKRVEADLAQAQARAATPSSPRSSGCSISAGSGSATKPMSKDEQELRRDHAAQPPRQGARPAR